MTDAQLQLLRRIADQGLQANMDVGIGANVLAALLTELEERGSTIADLRSELEECRKTLVIVHEDRAALRKALSLSQERAGRFEHEAEITKGAAKVLQRVRFILGGITDTTADCTEDDIRENAERALALLRKTEAEILARVSSHNDKQEPTQP